MRLLDVKIPVDVGDTIELWGLFDCHVDDAACDTARLKRDIQRIIDNPKAYAIIGGDFNNMIFANGDPRYVASVIRPAMRGEQAMADVVFDYNLKLLQPLADTGRLLCYMTGNHEEKFLKRHNTDVAKRTATALGVPYLGYEGFLTLFFTQMKKGWTKPKTSQLTGYLHHGHGAAAYVTQGTLTLFRNRAKLRFDWAMLGHIHVQTFTQTVSLERVGRFGNPQLQHRPIAQALCGTYQKTRVVGEDSFGGIEGHAEAPMGAGRIYFDVCPYHVPTNKFVVVPRVN